MKNDTDEFMIACSQQRDSFVNNFLNNFPTNAERVNAENILIMYDQLRERFTQSQREVERLKELIKHRITELNEADKLFCADRWDNTKNHMERSLAREESNKVTFARQELEQLYTALSNQPGDEKREG